MSCVNVTEKVLVKIAEQLTGIAKSDLSRAELNIASLLIRSGIAEWVIKEEEHLAITAYAKVG